MSGSVVSGTTGVSSAENQQNPQAATFNSLAVIEHLQQNLRQEQTRRLEVEKELSQYKQKCSDLQKQVNEHKDFVLKSQGLQQAQLNSVKKRLMVSLNKVIESGSAKNKSRLMTESVGKRKIEYVHQCDECTFTTKSDVSLILHKMNHMINEQQYVLSTTSFTTRNSNTKSIYTCSACETNQLTRHQVYRHIYDVHTTEKPLSCPYCELSFTHKDYLNHHLTLKHDKLPVPKFTSATSFNLLNTSSIEMTNRTVCEQSTGKHQQQPQHNSQQSSLVALQVRGGRARTSLTGNVKTSQIMSQSAQQQQQPLQGEMRCTFPDCNFETNIPDKLEFHMKAHVNTKYKCPYCPYVSNTIIDIKRHIQKSKKHEGMKMYSCQKCSFAADCDRAFKDHLRAYHFGYEAHDTVIEYFIEEMFSNKNKRSDEEDENNESNSSVNANSLQQISTNSSSNGHASANQTQTVVVPLPKKMINSSINQQQHTSPAPKQARMMIENSTGATQHASRTVSVVEPLQSNSSYRSTTHHNLNLTSVVNPNAVNVSNSLAMYIGHQQSQQQTFNQQSQQQAHAHHQQQQQQQQQHIQVISAQPHHGSRNSGGANGQHQPSTTAETLLSMPEGFVAQAINQTTNSAELSANLQQYVSYANY